MLTTVVKPNTYQDSVSLMLVSKKLTEMPDVIKVSVMMGTPANKDILRGTGFGSAALDSAQPGDMILAIDAEDNVDPQSVVHEAEEALANQAAGTPGSTLRTVRSFERAFDVLPEANLGLLSIPGDYVAAEADRLLERGVNVMIFSDNVSLDDEIALKRKAAAKGLLVMGPDCGTAMIGGAPLAFTNEVTRGDIGLVAASGTGAQEVMSAIDRLGGGVSTVLGLGGRDLSHQVGGLMCLQALAALADDASTSTIVIVSKPPAPEVRQKVAEAAKNLGKPVVIVFIGERPATARDGNVRYAYTLADAAALAVEIAGGGRPVFAPGQKAIRGLYTGGTLANEAAMLIRDAFGLTDTDPSHRQGYVLRSGGHEIVDLGDDAYTQGRPHPMIDPSARIEKMPAVFDDPATAVVLLDCVIGYGASDDPAGALAPAIRDGIEHARAAGRDVAVVVSVCGTRHDPQGYEEQRATLAEAGATVLPDNASAVRHALALLDEPAATSAGAAAPRPVGVAGLLAGRPAVVNVGVRSFAQTLHDAEVSTVQYDWTPVAGGDAELASLLDALQNV
ncbi:MAG TPA: acyl-CoA synthetase FdrA [Microbacteriaceae bacterium]|nr:acyl-CoA synthetase FdrA [Microbacteriaceae bacterium]